MADLNLEPTMQPQARPVAMIRGLPLGCAGLAACLALSLTLSACGGGSNPLTTPPAVSNPPVTGGQKLSFVYYQRCIQPILVTPLPVTLNGVTSTNTCAAAGCHHTATGTGGALRIAPLAADVDVTDPAQTPALLRASDMYKNYTSASGETVVNDAAQSRLLTKPLVQGVLHGGGQIFANAQDANALRILYWITHPMPQGQDEFSSSAAALFTPNDIHTGACNS